MSDLDTAVGLWRALLRALDQVRTHAEGDHARLLVNAIAATVQQRRADVEGAIAQGDGPTALAAARAAWQAVQDTLRTAQTMAAPEQRPLLERFANAAGAGAAGALDGLEDALRTLLGGAGAGLLILIGLYLMSRKKK